MQEKFKFMDSMLKILCDQLRHSGGKSIPRMLNSSFNALDIEKNY